MLKDSLLEYKGDTYYLSSDGSYVVNEEKEIDGKSYYFDENGKSIINLMTMNPTLGKCYINEEGKIAKAQWILQDNNWYYATDFGTLATGWVSTLNGDGSFEPYYFLPNGVMLVNAWQDNFYVGTDGKILKNTITPDGQQVDANGQKVVARAKSSYTSAPPMNSAFGPGGGPTGGATSMGSNVIVGGLGQASKVYQAQAEKTAEQQRIQADLDAKQRQKWAAMQDTSKDIQDSVNYGLINSGEYNKSH